MSAQRMNSKWLALENWNVIWLRCVKLKFIPNASEEKTSEHPMAGHALFIRPPKITPKRIFETNAWDVFKTTTHFCFATATTQFAVHRRASHFPGDMNLNWRNGIFSIANWIKTLKQQKKWSDEKKNGIKMTKHWSWRCLLFVFSV